MSGSSPRRMIWARTPEGVVRHLLPSHSSSHTLCGLKQEGKPWFKGSDEEGWHIAVCKNCCDVVAQAGEMLAVAVTRTGVRS